MSPGLVKERWHYAPSLEHPGCRPASGGGAVEAEGVLPLFSTISQATLIECTSSNVSRLQ